MKNVKKMLSEQANAVLPDKNVKSKVLRELGMTERETALAPAHGGEVRSADKRKILIPIAAAMLAVALFLCIFLPIFLSREKGNGFIGNKFADITDADSFYAYGAASVGSLLTSAENVGGAQAMSLSSVLSAAADTKTEAEEAHIETINRYMALAEGLLSEENIAAESLAGEYGYAFGMAVKLGDLLGGGATYRLFYDKIIRGGGSEGDEREENYAISGILIADGARYAVEGNYQTEEESGEAESELYFKAYTDDTGESYIEVEQEYENESEGGASETEQKYIYSIYENGRLTERTTAEYESEEGEIELLLRIEKDGELETLQFQSGRKNGENVLFASGTIGGERLRFTVYIREGGYHYEFSDGSSSDQDRFDDDDEDDEDDDDDDD